MAFETPPSTLWPQNRFRPATEGRVLPAMRCSRVDKVLEAHLDVLRHCFLSATSSLLWLT